MKKGYPNMRTGVAFKAAESLITRHKYVEMTLALGLSDLPLGHQISGIVAFNPPGL